MNKRVEAQFEALGKKLIQDAERIDCPLADFAEGLRALRMDVSDRLQLVEDELRVREAGQ